MANPNTPIIVKKVKKVHGGHHGGSWKVAYADFVTAMMAFFLLLWLLTMASPEKKAAISEFFNHYNIFDPSGASIRGDYNVKDTSAELMPKLMSKPAKEGEGGEKRELEDKNQVVILTGGGLSSEDLIKRLKDAVEEKLKGIKDQVLIDYIEGGVSVQIVDNEGGIMFHSGSAEPTPRSKEIIRVLAENIKGIPNRIAVEGHTDAAPVRAGGMTNWELSTARASAARRELEQNGIEPARIARVVGYADQEPYIKHNPLDPRNRRISIILLMPKK